MLKIKTMEKKLLILLISFIFSGCNPFLKKKNEEFHLIIDKQNILYSGVENPITLCIPIKYVGDSLYLNVNNGDCKKGAKIAQWVILPNETGLCELKVFSENNIIYDFTFRIVQVPLPILGVRGAFEHTLSDSKDLSHLLAFPPEEFPYDIRYYIISFDLLIYFSNSKTVQKSNLSEKFSEEIISLISQNQLQIDSLKFEKVLFTYPDGTTGKVDSYIVRKNI